MTVENDLNGEEFVASFKELTTDHKIHVSLKELLPSVNDKWLPRFSGC